MSTSTPSTAVDIVRASLVETDAGVPGLAVSAFGERRELGREALRFEAQERRHHDGPGQLPDPFERLIEARAAATDRSGPIEHAVEVDLAADDGVRDDGVAGSRAHGDGAVLEPAQRRRRARGGPRRGSCPRC